MKKVNEKKYYDQIKDWNFDEFQIETESLTSWDMYELLKEVTDENSKILDLGTGGGEKVLSKFPSYAKEILGISTGDSTKSENFSTSGILSYEIYLI